MSKACKSYGLFFFGSLVSGKRVRNTLVTYPELVNNHAKVWLIHNIDEGTSVILIESFGGTGEAYGLSASW